MAAISPCSSILSSAIADQYELLRGAALGQALPLRARSGLMLFLRRGMWGWAQTLAAATIPRRNKGIRPQSPGRRMAGTQPSFTSSRPLL